jgi:hypothetical protein
MFIITFMTAVPGKALSSLPQVPWENLLHIEEFSIRIPESQLHKVLNIVQAVSKERWVHHYHRFCQELSKHTACSQH